VIQMLVLGKLCSTIRKGVDTDMIEANLRSSNLPNV
jgi:hypothetical protein